MQLPNAPDVDRFQSIEFALHGDRIARYMPAAGNKRSMAFQYYLWNCSLCEAFFVPLHFSEIVCRNAMHRAIMARGDPKWFDNRTFRQILDQRFRTELDAAISKEHAQHGARMTSHHIVSALTFGFREHLATKRFERYLWAKGIHGAFPTAPKNATYEQLHSLIESVRRWRNRIAHHRAIFDKGPMRKYKDALELISWVCGDTYVWVASVSRVPAAIAIRPKS